MSAAAPAPATPQRPLPGGFINTPAPLAPTIFAANAATLKQNAAVTATDLSNPSVSSTQTMTPIQRAARTVDETLAQENRYPELESYVAQGFSGEYDIPNNPAWAPYQRLKDYSIPQRLLEQTAYADVETHMGLLPALGHAWLALDNCLYLWDYTLPNPDLVGWEESSQPISAIKLVKPKPGVFIQDIQHLLVVVTNADLVLLGVTVQTAKNGSRTIQLYNTRMSISVRGLNVSLIEYSRLSGRIFFTSATSDDIYEFQYQQDEGWFRGRTARICHTQNSLRFMPSNAMAVAQFWNATPTKQSILDMTIDDSRNLLYTINSTNEIRIWFIKNDLQLTLHRNLINLIQSSGHFSPRTELLTAKDLRIISISPISASESLRIGAMITLNNGCRLYMSITRGYGYQADAQNPPSNMQILHIRFPPIDEKASSSPSRPAQPAMNSYNSAWTSMDAVSYLMKNTKRGDRFAPGYFLAVRDSSIQPDLVYCIAPDTARIKNSQDLGPPTQRFAEFGMSMELPGSLYEAVPMASTFATSREPVGFGNELAWQFDQPSSDIALVTTGGIRVIRRRRLVDILAAIMKFGTSNDEGREGDVKRFVRMYGRAETSATALAVACGQGMDVAPDSRLTSVTDPEVLEGARRVFVEHGGKPEYNTSNLPEVGRSQIDTVRPSPRHEGMALYIARLVRSIWMSPVIQDNTSPGDGPKVVSAVSTDKLRSIQRDLNSLSEFLEHNKSFIEGLAGPHALNRAGSRQEEIAMQGEHRAMNSLVQLISAIVEGISFALVLFDERIEAILSALSDENRAKVRELRYLDLFVSATGRGLAKELVKAIVNYNIANGGNVDTVAEALRRRCGSFCSADDVVIFKAQEQVKRASEAGSQSETGRVLLNESQRLFSKVATSLSMEHLHWATERYVEAAFYAGAIQLCLVVAAEKDRAKIALGWLRDGMSDGDERKDAFEARKRCYDLIFSAIQALDLETGGSAQNAPDGQSVIMSKRRSEAYDVVNRSDDAVFQTCLFDWYISIGQADRLLDIHSNWVVDYLKRRAREDRAHADLLWRYWAHQNDYLQAASVQLDLARGFFDLTLEERIQYLSRARTNASTRQTALIDSRQNKQQLLREISDLLDLGNIQDDILQRMKSDARLTGDRRSEVLKHLNGPILSIDELFNQFADQAGYYDISLQIFQIADHRNPADIKSTWQNLIDQTDDSILAQAGQSALPWELVSEKVRELGRRLELNEVTFPLPTLLPMLERWAMQYNDRSPSPTWAVDLFLYLEIPHERLLPILEHLFYANEQPFTGTRRKAIANQLVYLLKSWFKESQRRGERVAFGSDEAVQAVSDRLTSLLRGNELDQTARRDAEELNANIARALR